MSTFTAEDIHELIDFCNKNNVKSFEMSDGSLKFSLSSAKETVPLVQNYQSTPDVPVPNYSAENPFK